MLLHSIIAIFQTVPGKILFVGTVAMDAVLSFFAVAEPASNRTLIILAICGNVTVLIGVVFTGWIQLKSARISAANSAMLKPLTELPHKVTELSKGIDGVAHELKAAKEEGAVARVDAANARGQLEGREAEVAKQGADALARQTREPAQVEVVQPDDKPVPRQIEIELTSRPNKGKLHNE